MHYFGISCKEIAKIEAERTNRTRSCMWILREVRFVRNKRYILEKSNLIEIFLLIKPSFVILYFCFINSTSCVVCTILASPVSRLHYEYTIKLSAKECH